MKMKETLNNVLAYAAVVLLWVAIGLVGYHTVKSWFKGPNNFYELSQSFYICHPIDIKHGEKTIVVRLDDVQATLFKETAKRMIDDALDREVMLSLGVIPKGLDGDKDLVRFLKKRLCNIEIALHGWDHSSREG